MSRILEEMKQELEKRLNKAISESFSPTPLIGPKWLQQFPNSRPADFRYFGIPKIAKAIGIPRQQAMYRIMRHLDLGGLGVRMYSTQDCMIDVYVIEGHVEEIDNPKAVKFRGRLVGKRPVVWGEMAKQLAERAAQRHEDEKRHPHHGDRPHGDHKSHSRETQSGFISPKPDQKD